MGPRLESEQRLRQRRGESERRLGGSIDMGRDEGNRGVFADGGMKGFPETPPAGKGVGLGLLGHAGGVRASPFSDYFTDDGRSPGFEAEGRGREVQRLLVRLNEVGAMVMRAGEDGLDGRGVGRIVERKVDELEAALERALAGREGVGDSAIFMEDEEGSPSQRARRGGRRVHGVDDLPTPSTSPTKATQESERLLHTARHVLKRVSFAQEELRSRHEELQQLHTAHSMELEDREQAIETLSAENEQLKADLGFGRSELLFLKLQMEGLKVELGEEGGLSEKGKDYLESGFKFMREDWRQIEEGFRKRGENGGKREAEYGDTARDNEGAGEWTVQLQRERSGKVQRVSAVRQLIQQSDTIAEEDVQLSVEDSTTLKSSITDPEPQRPHLTTRDSSCQTHAFLFRANSNLNLNTQAPQATRKPPKTDSPTTPTTITYTSQAIQTTPSRRESSTASITASETSSIEEYADPAEGPDGDSAADQVVFALPPVALEHPGHEVDECAVTSASEVNVEDHEEDEEVRPRRAGVVWGVEPERLGRGKKTAWQELWDSLGNLAGMGEGEVDYD